MECAENSNGSLGTCTGTSTPPVGYHPNCPFCGMAQVYDWGHDGWATGIPPFMGDYTNPGFPFEGWAIQIGTTTSQAYQSCTGGISCCTFGGPAATLGTLVSGGHVGYTNVGGKAKGFWQGTESSGNLTIKQETRVDVNSSWILFTVKMYNTSASPITKVFYERTCDPDNESIWSSAPGYTGAWSTTQNEIVYQNDAQHRVMCNSYGNYGSFNKANSYMALGTKDCRAVCTIFNGGLQPGFSPEDIWNKVPAGYLYPAGSTNYSDVGYALVFNVGTICAHDSAVVSFAYMFGGDFNIDSAFPDPMFQMMGKAPVDTSVRDTFDACLYPTVDSILLTVPFGDERSWSFSSWTWSPAIGLSATTGTSVWARVKQISGIQTYTLTGTDSVGGCGNNPSCLGKRTFYFTLKSCHAAWSNNPCYGDSLIFRMSGDSIGATYKWVGPKGWTSALHNPGKYPALYSDSGVYYVYKTILGITDTDSIRVVVHEKPVLIVTNNSPMCSNTVSTLKLSATPLIPGETFAWTGPNGFTATGQFPSITPFLPVNTGLYEVISTTPFGCKDTGQVSASLVNPPIKPSISGKREYCQRDTGSVWATPMPLGSTGTINWYTASTGGTATASPVIDTTPGVHTYFASTTSTFGCEGPRDSFTVHIINRPKAPALTGGIMEYCQFIGTYVPVSPILAHPGSLPPSFAEWWTVPSGGISTPTPPVVDLSKAGVTTFYVSQNDSGCESPRAPVVVTVHPKPAPPTIKSDSICQFFPAKAMVATPSISGDLIRWFIGSGDTIGTLTAPVPVTLVPGLQDFFANELSPFGCLSDKAKGTLYVKPKPMEPVTRDTMWCQFTQVKPLTADSIFGGNLRWYIDGITQANAPVPYNTIPGDSTYYVANVVNGCVSDSVPLKVTVIYKPVFAIEAGSPFVCQFDSVKFAYKGPSIFDPKYSWSIPEGASYAINGETGRSLASDSTIYVRFDSVTQNNYIHLHVTNNGGFCSNDTSVRIKIVPQPYGKAQTKGDVCQGDTVILALGAKSASAANFKWYIDNVLMDQTNALSIVAHDNNSGGPFSITWNDSGRHVIQVRSTTIEGCTSLPTEDTIKVHTKPDAVFSYAAKSGLCLEDSVLFVARDNDYRNAYTWLPEHSFSNVNKREIYGRVEQTVSIITLQVTDPFGCTASTSQTLNPSTCCVVGFPTVFTPNGDGKNDVFRPIYNGYHRFHEFRIANRWGQTVFESTNSDMSWNGNFNGVPQDMGVYFYYIKYDCGGKSIEKTGDVTLVR